MRLDNRFSTFKYEKGPLKSLWKMHPVKKTVDE